MSTQTPNLGLIKPADNETADIQIINQNMDKIDAAFIAKILEAKGYTDEKIAMLISAAPGALDTLNELAIALGNDPNFATTILNRLTTIEQDDAAHKADNTAHGLNNKVNKTGRGTISHNSGKSDPNTLVWSDSVLELNANDGTSLPMISFHKSGVSAIGLYEKDCRLHTIGSDGRIHKRILDIDDYTTLFQYANDGKTAVANAITAKGVVASSTDTFSALATKIGQIITGKRVATGTVNCSPGTLSFSLTSGSSYSTNYVTVTGLAFKPRFIIAYNKTDDGPFPEAVYVEGGHAKQAGNIAISSCGQYNFVSSANLIIGSNNFQLPVLSGGVVRTYEWVAIE